MAGYLQKKKKWWCIKLGFIEGMIFCFIGGWINSYLYSYHLRKKHKGWIFWFALLWLGSILTIDVLIYLNLLNVYAFEVFPWIHIPENVAPKEVGKYWMFTPGIMLGINVFVLPVDNFNAVGWNLFAVFLFISYVWWFTIGQNLGRFMYGRLIYERGAWYLLRSTKMIRKSKSKLDKKIPKNK